MARRERRDGPPDRQERDYDRQEADGDFGDNERESKFVSAHQRVLHDSQHASRIRLPVIPR